MLPSIKDPLSDPIQSFSQNPDTEKVLTCISDYLLQISSLDSFSNNQDNNKESQELVNKEEVLQLLHKIRMLSKSVSMNFDARDRKYSWSTLGVAVLRNAEKAIDEAQKFKIMKKEAEIKRSHHKYDQCSDCILPSLQILLFIGLSIAEHLLIKQGVTHYQFSRKECELWKNQESLQLCQELREHAINSSTIFLTVLAIFITGMLSCGIFCYKHEDVNRSVRMFTLKSLMRKLETARKEIEEQTKAKRAEISKLMGTYQESLEQTKAKRAEIRNVMKNQEEALRDLELGFLTA